MQKNNLQLHCVIILKQLHMCILSYKAFSFSHLNQLPINVKYIGSNINVHVTIFIISLKKLYYNIFEFT